MSNLAGGFPRGISERGRFTLNLVMGNALVLFRALTSPLKIPVSCMHHGFLPCNRFMRPHRGDCLRFSPANAVWSFLVPAIDLNIQSSMLQRLGVPSYANVMAGGSNTVVLGRNAIM